MLPSFNSRNEEQVSNQPNGISCGDITPTQKVYFQGIWTFTCKSPSIACPHPPLLQIPYACDACIINLCFFLCSDMRVVQMFARPPWQRNLGSWYPPTHSSLLIRLQRLGLFHDEHSNFRQQMAIQRRARGKGPPEKGHIRRKNRNVHVLFTGILCDCR